MYSSPARQIAVRDPVSALLDGPPDEIDVRAPGDLVEPLGKRDGKALLEPLGAAELAAQEVGCAEVREGIRASLGVVEALARARALAPPRCAFRRRRRPSRECGRGCCRRAPARVPAPRPRGRRALPCRRLRPARSGRRSGAAARATASASPVFPASRTERRQATAPLLRLDRRLELAGEEALVRTGFEELGALSRIEAPGEAKRTLEVGGSLAMRSARGRQARSGGRIAKEAVSVVGRVGVVREPGRVDVRGRLEHLEQRAVPEASRRPPGSSSRPRVGRARDETSRALPSRGALRSKSTRRETSRASGRR